VFNVSETTLFSPVAVVVVVRIVEAIGAEEALKLLYKTEDLEEAGGLMTVVC